MWQPRLIPKCGRSHRSLNMDAVDPDVSRVADNLHFNHRLSAPNVWEVAIDKSLIDEAASIFSAGGAFDSVTREGEPYETIESSVGPFFVQRINWQSDVCLHCDHHMSLPQP